MNPAKIVIVSRDEKKQFDMASAYSDHSHVLDFRIADVRDYDRVEELMEGVQIVYHAAALKQVPMCESHPFEAVKTNIVGAENIRRAAISSGSEAVIAVSTDKAVKPVNAMGMTKALQEKIFLQPSLDDLSTRFVCVRYGNVLGSRGSVVPFYHGLIRRNAPLPITHPDMTRFMLTLEQAIDLVFKATVSGRNGELLVRKMPACRIIDLAEIMGRRIGGRADYPTVISGIRPGEKIHEVLVSEEEMRRSTELDEYFVIHPHAQSHETDMTSALREYTSQNTRQMPAGELETLLDENKWLSSKELVADSEL